MDTGEQLTTARRPWFTTVATALVWGAFFGAVPAAAALIIPFVGYFVVPIASGGAAIGFATAAGACLAVVVLWRVVESRPVTGFFVAAAGGFLGCWGLVLIFDTVSANVAPLLPKLAVEALAAVVAGALLPGFSRRLAVPTHPVVGVGLVATLVATACSTAASLLAFDATSLGGSSWSRDDEACRETSAYGALVGRVIAYLPAQSTCVYQNGSVETVPRSDHVQMALIAGIGLVAIALAWVLFAGRHRSHVFLTQAAALVSATAVTLILLALFGASLYGAFGPVATTVSP